MNIRVEEKLNELLANGSLSRNDPKFKFFKEKILPSVVLQWQLPNGENSFYFKCPFENCQSLCSRSVLLERHLKEQHHDQIPLNVFGFKSSFQCNICNNQVFKRFEHLKTHKRGNKHLKMLIQSGLASDEEKYRWRQICLLKKESKSFDFTQNTSKVTSNSDSSISSFGSRSKSHSDNCFSIINSLSNNIEFETENKNQNYDCFSNLSLNELLSSNLNNNFLTSTPTDINSSLLKNIQDHDDENINSIIHKDLLNFFQIKDSISENYSFEQKTSPKKSENKCNLSSKVQSKTSNLSIKNCQNDKLSFENSIFSSNHSDIPQAQRPLKKRKLDEEIEQKSLSFDTIETMILSKRTIACNDFD